MDSEKLLIDILKFGINKGSFLIHDLIEELNKKEEYKELSQNDRRINIWLNIYFTQNLANLQNYSLKSEAHLALLQIEQLIKSRELVEAAQAEANAAQTQANAAIKEAKASEIQAKKANFIAIAALVVSIFASIGTMIYSHIQLGVAITGNKHSLQQFEFDKAEAAKKDPYIEKVDTIICLQRKMLKKKK